MPETIATPEIRVDCPDDKKFDVVTNIKKGLAKEHQIIDIDGVRVQYPGGWGLVRASNTQPALVLRFEAVDEGTLKEIQNDIEKRLFKLI